jgi:hypothetical protein
MDLNRPVDGAEVRLLRVQQRFFWQDPETVLISSATSNAVGGFELSTQLTGDFFITISKSGYCSLDPVGHAFSMTSTGTRQVTEKLTRRDCRIVL